MTGSGRRRAGAGALAALAALALAACGGDGDDGRPRLSRDDYVRQGTRICRDYLAGLGRLGTPRKAADVPAFFAQAVPLLERQVTRLEDLRPPEELDGEFTAYLRAARATHRRAVALRDAAGRAQGEVVERLLAESRRAAPRTDGLAIDADLPACAGIARG